MLTRLRVGGKDPGSVAPTRTPTDSSASTSRKEPTSPGTPAAISTLSPSPSTPDPAKPSAGEHPPKPSTSFYAHSNKAVLQRPLEPAQYTSWAFTRRAHQSGLVPSMGSNCQWPLVSPRGRSWVFPACGHGFSPDAATVFPAVFIWVVVSLLCLGWRRRVGWIRLR